MWDTWFSFFSLDTYESDEMSKHTKNTCFFESFKSYLLARKLKEGLSKDVYPSLGK